MGGHIDCYLDCSSFYSLITILYLIKQREKLSSHSVSVEFHPIFLGGVNVGSGNKPPWTLPAKAVYGKFDMARALQHHGMPAISTPSFFPPLTLLPQRALCFVKSKYPAPVFEETWIALFNAMWYAHRDITIPEEFTKVLEETSLFKGDGEVQEILEAATKKEWKDALMKNTEKVLAQGAFGAPWMWVRNREGKEEPFFGSDRFHFMWEFLAVPYQDLEILPKEKAKL